MGGEEWSTDVKCYSGDTVKLDDLELGINQSGALSLSIGEYNKRERSKSIKEQNRLNKARSRSMETKVAKLLNGKRVPMSGSGALKGDGIANSHVGMFLFECKYSAQVHKNEGPSIRMEYRWFTKIDHEVHSMNASFGMLVFFYHNQKYYVVVMRSEIYERVFGIDSPEVLVEDLKHSGFNMTERKLKGFMARGRKNVEYSMVTPVGKLVVMYLDRFSDLMDSVNPHAELGG